MRVGSRTVAAIVLGLLAAAGPPLFVFWFVAQERTVYFWDIANYWVILTDLTARFRASPGAAIGHAIQSLTTDKYNELAALPLLPAALLFGTSRPVYAAAVASCFALPTAALLALLVRMHRARAAVDEARGDALRPVLAALLAAALLPQLWYPIVIGGLDVIGCVPILLVFLLIAPAPAAPPPPGRAFVIGLLLGLLPLLRRWYAFFDVAFLATFWGFVGLGTLFEAGSAARGRAIRRVLLAGSAMLGGLLITSLPLWGPVGASVFLRDHVHLHAPYLRTPGLLGAAWRTWTYLGSIPLGLAACGLAGALLEPRHRRFALLLAVQAALTVLLFNRVQTLGANHFHLILPTLLFFESYALLRLFEMPSGVLRTGLVAAVSLLLVLNFAAALVPPFAGSEIRMAPAMTALFGRLRHEPLRRHDLEEIARLARAVERARASAAPGPVYVLASSEVFNPDILRNASLSLPGRPDVPDLRGAVVPGVHLDRRDGFPEALLAARVVVAAEPPQLHLAPEDQRVVSLPLREILAGTTIGRSFRALPETFVLEEGVVARIFVRDASIDPADLRAFRALLAPALAVAAAGDGDPDGADGADRAERGLTRARPAS